MDTTIKNRHMVVPAGPNARLSEVPARELLFDEVHRAGPTGTPHYTVNPRLAVIICGPQGCGKTTHGQALAAHFGKTRVVDNFQPGQKLEPTDLALTCCDVFGENAFGFEHAMRAAGLVTPR